MILEAIIIIITVILFLVAVWLLLAKPEPKWKELPGDDPAKEKLKQG